MKVNSININMEKKKIITSISRLINKELDELRDTLKSYQLWKMDFPEEENINLNLKEEDGHYSNWIVRSVFLDNKDHINIRMHLYDFPYRPDEPDDRDCDNVIKEDEINFANSTIPGEISVITQAIKTYAETRNVCLFDLKKCKAMDAVNAALKNLVKCNIGLVYDQSEMILHYINTEQISKFCSYPYNDNTFFINVKKLPAVMYSKDNTKLKIMPVTEYGDVPLELNSSGIKTNS